MVTFDSPQEARRRELIEKLFRETAQEKRCPYLRRDKISAYCSKDIQEMEEINEQRRNVCDSSSLQLWCLDINRCPTCIWYQGEKFE